MEKDFSNSNDWKIKSSNLPSYVSVKNGFATLANKVFIGDFEFLESSIRYGSFSSAVVYNDYEDFAEKVVHYVKFL